MTDNRQRDMILSAENGSASLFERITVPQGLYSRLDETDFSCRDVLVGSLGSREQLHDNLKRNYYYVPAKYISASDLPIRYIAIFQSKSLFGQDACIQYFGEVSETKRLLRKDIKFPMRRQNSDEPYYAFGIKEWKKLSVPISVTYEVVYEPKFTNSFLLHSCGQSYELFNINSAEQFLLLHELKRMYSEAVSAASSQFESVCRTKDGKSLWIHDGYIDIIDTDGKKLVEPPITLSDFERDPRRCFCTIALRLSVT